MKILKSADKNNYAAVVHLRNGLIQNILKPRISWIDKYIFY